VSEPDIAWRDIIDALLRCTATHQTLIKELDERLFVVAAELDWVKDVLGEILDGTQPVPALATPAPSPPEGE